MYDVIRALHLCACILTYTVIITHHMVLALLTFYLKNPDRPTTFLNFREFQLFLLFNIFVLFSSYVSYFLTVFTCFLIDLFVFLQC